MRNVQQLFNYLNQHSAMHIYMYSVTDPVYIGPLSDGMQNKDRSAHRVELKAPKTAFNCPPQARVG